MIEIDDDIFKYIGPHNPLVVTTNSVIKRDGALVMGAGIAKLVRDRFPGIDKKMGCSILSLSEYNIMPIRMNNQLIIGLQTKIEWQGPSPIDLVVRSCQTLLDYVNDFGEFNENPCLDIEKVYMTRPGCGNGWLDWNYVKPLISFLDDRFIICNKV